MTTDFPPLVAAMALAWNGPAARAAPISGTDLLHRKSRRLWDMVLSLMACFYQKRGCESRKAAGRRQLQTKFQQQSVLLETRRLVPHPLHVFHVRSRVN